MTGTTNGNLSEILFEGLTTAVDLGSNELADGFAEGRSPADGVKLHPLPRLGVDLDVDRAGCGPAGIALTPVGPGATSSGHLGQVPQPFPMFRGPGVEDELGVDQLSDGSAEAPGTRLGSIIGSAARSTHRPISAVSVLLSGGASEAPVTS